MCAENKPDHKICVQSKIVGSLNEKKSSESFVHDHILLDVTDTHQLYVATALFWYAKKLYSIDSVLMSCMIFHHGFHQVIGVMPGILAASLPSDLPSL